MRLAERWSQHVITFESISWPDWVLLQDHWNGNDVRRLLDAMAREPFVADGAPLVALVEAIGAEIDVVFDDEGDEKDAAGDGGDDARGEDTDSEYTDDEDVEKGAFCGPGGADGAANPVGDCGAGSRKGASSVFSW